MPSKQGRAWTQERASVSAAGRERPRSNKYRPSDSGKQPSHARQRVWVGGYTRADGRKVEGYYRATARGAG
jgi:hypothetical protein